MRPPGGDLADSGPAVRASSPGPSAVWVAVGLVLLSALIYNLNLREVSMDDTIATRFLPLSILAEGDLDLDEFPALHQGETDPAKLPYYLQYRHGHYYSSYPVLGALMAVPVYVVPTMLGLFDAEEPDFSVDVGIVSKVAASLIAALSVAFVYLACRGLFGHRWALGSALIYAFATTTFSISSQGLWQHGPAQLWLAVALWCLLPGGPARSDGRPANWALLLGGLALALAVAARAVLAVPAVVFFLYVCRRHWRALPYFLAGPVVVAALLAYYNLSHFGTLLGGEQYLGTLHPLMHTEQGSWKLNFLPGLYGLLFSANRGLVVFTPVVLVAAAGAERGWRENRLSALKWVSVAAGLTLLAYSFYSVWWGGWTYGPRYSSDFLPLMAVLVAGGLERAWAVPRARLAVMATVAYCVAVQLVGFLAYTPARWNLYDPTGSRLNVDLYHQRLWDWSDWEVLRYLRAGLAPNVFQEKARDHAGYADSLLAQGQTPQAEFNYREALYWNSDNVRANTGLGILLMGRDELAPARAYLLRAVEVKPTDSASQHNLGYYYLRVNRPGDALTHLSRAVQLQPTRLATWRYLAAAFYRLGRYGEALKVTRGALALDPQDTQMQQLKQELETLLSPSEGSAEPPEPPAPAPAPQPQAPEKPGPTSP